MQHPEVWAEATPFTSDDILALDAYCRERFIELVPNQNSFGHMHRWLKHPKYGHLAETHEKVIEWMNEIPFTLAPTEPGSVELMAGIYDELLPNFTSPMFNIGADETWTWAPARQVAGRRKGQRARLSRLRARAL